MKLINKNCRNLLLRIFLMFGVLFIGSLCSSSVGAAELSFKAVDKRMLFSIPYETVPEINALFFDQGERVVLTLPTPGLKAGIQEQPLDDDWVTAFGIESDGQELRWYLKKRDPALRVKSFLALERKKSALQVVLLKEYRRWSAPIRADEPVAPAPGAEAEVSVETQTSGKMSRIRQLLEHSDGGGDEVASEVDGTSKSSPSLLMSGLRSLIALVFLVLVIVALSMLLKRYRRGRGGLGSSGIVKVLGIEMVTGKHQVMLLELLDEVMVVGISGEQMTVLTTITDPGKVEELRLLKDGRQSGKRFGGYLKGLLEREPETEEKMPVSTSGNAVATAAYQHSATALSEELSEETEESEEMPENYQEVLSQIKDRLNGSERSW
ncbi:MAG: flagellar biosynthetic protein FliO [Pseudomonadota bacterium]|nr:flagellar biosynthetic protein FliO [Pseudomonadota bacterium]